MDTKGGLLTWRYKHFHDFLMRHLLDVLFYYVVMYFDDIYYVLMIWKNTYKKMRSQNSLS